MAQLSKPGIAIAVVVGAVFVAVFGIHAIGPSFAPSSQRPLENLSETSLSTLTARFDAAADSTRLLVLLSPT